MATRIDKNLPPQERYKEKLFVGSSHSWALELLSAMTPEQSLLDIGPGTGVMGRLLKQQGISKCDAVEIDPEAREFVRPHYREVTEDISELDAGQYDYVLMLDVLEHMADPERFLRDLDPIIKPGGEILISVPNIAHWSVRFSLLFGQFRYQERGILDRTHLRFFTRSSLKKMVLEQAGFRVIRQGATIEPLELILPGWLTENKPFQFLSRLRLKFAQLLPGLMAFQHLIYLKKQNLEG